MVRIFKVDKLQVQKRELIARSEIYRQTLRLEMKNVRLSMSLLKKRLHVLKAIYRVLGVAVPVGGLLFGHKEEGRKRGFISSLLSGFNLASRLKSMFSGGKPAQHAPEEAEDSGRL